MSSMATAPSRIPEKSDAPYGFESARVESAAHPNSNLDEVTRVERLLTQLEARSMALVPYGYGTLREVPPKNSHTSLIAGALAALWLITVVLGIWYVRSSRVALTAERAPVAPLVIPSAPDPQEQKVASSVDHLAKALVSSSERLNQIEAAMERSNRDLQHIASKVAAERPKPAVVVAAPKTQNPKIEAAKPEAASSATPANADSGLPKNWHRVLEIKPSDAASPHKGADGGVDYWLVPRGAEKAKVLPIGTTADGVVVHNLEDGKDYTLTPSGEWRSGAITGAN